MNDRALLELAAKACGMSVYEALGKMGRPISNYAKWNPLTDDGDALRLAVALSFDLYINPDGVEVFSGDLSEEITLAIANGDLRATVRCAIVIAAAAIGAAV